MVLLISARLLLEVLGTVEPPSDFFLNSWYLVDITVMYLSDFLKTYECLIVIYSCWVNLKRRGKAPVILVFPVFHISFVFKSYWFYHHYMLTIWTIYASTQANLTVLTLASALHIVFLTATRTILLMKASLCHFSAQNPPGLFRLIFAVAYEVSLSLLLFLLHLL